MLSVIKICRIKYGCFPGRKVNSEKEAWRSVLLSSQYHYPIKTGKAWTVCDIGGVKCRVRRLEGGDANMVFGTKFLPIISNQDPIMRKLIRLAHSGKVKKKVRCIEPQVEPWEDYNLGSLV